MTAANKVEDQTMTTPDGLRYVEGELNYLVPMPERPRYYAYDAGPEAPPTNMAHEAHRVQIHDMRPISAGVAPAVARPSRTRQSRR